MKRCPECYRPYPVERVICLDCDEILEENQYLRIVCVTLGISAVAHFLLGRMGQPGLGWITETLISSVLLLILSVCVWKLIQKLKEPQRRIARELASLYSDRSGRGIIIVVLAAVILFWTGVLSPRTVSSTRSELFWQYNTIRFYVVMIGFWGYLAIAIYYQGLGFFDLRIANPMALQEPVDDDEVESL